MRPQSFAPHENSAPEKRDKFGLLAAWKLTAPCGLFRAAVRGSECWGSAARGSYQRRRNGAAWGCRAAATCHRWFLRGFANRFSLVSVFALFSDLFSRIDFPVFLALLFLGDFSDNGITPF
jgi:hypothetical protein